jgi:hypothetical protein
MTEHTFTLEPKLTETACNVRREGNVRRSWKAADDHLLSAHDGWELLVDGETLEECTIEVSASICYSAIAHPHSLPQAAGGQ